MVLQFCLAIQFLKKKRGVASSKTPSCTRGQSAALPGKWTFFRTMVEVRGNDWKLWGVQLMPHRLQPKGRHSVRGRYEGKLSVSLAMFSLRSEAGCIWHGTSSTNQPSREDYLLSCDTVLMWSHYFWTLHAPGDVHNTPSSWKVANLSMPKAWQLLEK